MLLLFGPLAVVIWALAHASGIHATIADVAMGLLVRTRARDGETVSPSHRTEEILRPFSAGIALPVFALTSAGVSLSSAGGFWTSTITWRFRVGLLAGKFTGIFAAAWLTSRFTSAHLTDAKGAILFVSGVATLLAAVVLGCRGRHHRRRDEHTSGREAVPWTQG
ncbi:Na+/H+ antiporter NhaA [Streptomyces sp. NPDC002817]|uniref:Na+/H+ antiporter NhaA n=1 Tax=Streptomyces sp. NPDC088357 TaxID=3154655 RepID=UPI0034292C6F